MEISNEALNKFCKTIFVLPAVVIDYEPYQDKVMCCVCDPSLNDLPYEVKMQASFAAFDISKAEFETITGIKI